MMQGAVVTSGTEGGVVRHTPASYCEANPTCANTPSEIMDANIRANSKLGLPNLYGQPPNGGHVVIVGGGASVADHLAEIKHFHQLRGHEIVAINGMGRFLTEKGIIPSILLMVDSRPHMGRFLDGVPKAVDLLLGSNMDPVVIRQAIDQGYKVTLWHHGIDGGDNWPEIERPYTVVRSTANSGGLLAILVAGILGFKHAHLYGFDSCYWRGNGHPYPQPENDGEFEQEISVFGQAFLTTPWMGTQAALFPHVVEQAEREFGLSVFVHGPGLIRAYADAMRSETARKALDGRTATQSHDKDAA